MMTIRKVIFFFVASGVLLGLVMVAFPKNGIMLGDIKLTMPTFTSLVGLDTVQYADITKMIEGVKEIEGENKESEMQPGINPEDHLSKSKIDSINNSFTGLDEAVRRLEFGKMGKENLLKFFKVLRAGETEKKQVRIMHYGDSQIEGDRMTSFLRNKFQGKYGGTGFGLVPALQPYETGFTFYQSTTGNWRRYSIVAGSDKQVKSKKYGALASFSRYAPQQADSIPPDSTLYKATVSFRESKLGYQMARQFKRIRIYYGNARLKTSVRIRSGETLLVSDSLKAKTDLAVFEYTSADYLKSIIIEFAGYDSPDIFGIDIGDVKGIQIDNIPWRGNSGTIFTRIDYDHLMRMYKELNTRLFILQFGGNVMPYTHDKKTADAYGGWFYGQLARLKKMMPEASFIVIGPSDMSHKVGEHYITYEYLPQVRDALKKATFDAGFAYWDTYEAMGGHNSMPSWVAANPQLAGADYTHFTPAGAKLVSNMFYNAIMLEFKESK